MSQKAKAAMSQDRSRSARDVDGVAAVAASCAVRCGRASDKAVDSRRRTWRTAERICRRAGGRWRSRRVVHRQSNGLETSRDCGAADGGRRWSRA